MKPTAITIVLVLAAMQTAGAQKGRTPVPATPTDTTTRGIGVYPGDPREDFAPTFRIDSTSYRNLARHRPAYHSSSYDYNLTAQLVTDGIVETALPRWVVIASGQQGLISTLRRDLPAPLADGPLSGYARQQSVWPRHKREWLIDGNWVTGFDLKGPQVWVQVELHGGAAPLAIDRVEVEARVQALGAGPENWTCTVLGSSDGAAWTPLGSTSGMARVGGDIRPVVQFAEPSRHRYYRVVFDDPRAITWRIGEVNFSHAATPVRVGGPHQFSSAWMSAGRGEQWVYVDLGAPCTFDRVALHWLARPAEATLQVSDDAVNWRALQPLAAATGNDDDVRLTAPARGRYVRVLMTKAASPDGYVLTEIEVFGRGGPVPVARPLAPARADGRLDLAGGRWRLQRDSQVTADGKVLSTPGFEDGEWLIATVPATVLSSYYNAGALPDPNFGDNQLMISDAFFHADFWYRTEFDTPPAAAGRKQWLNFDGINRNADVFLNGEKLGRIEGGFVRARFDVSSRLVAGAPNALAVRIEKNSTPGSVKEKTFEHPDTNGGELGADNPTYHASIGWDWIPTIRGRNTGIWNDVYVTNSGPVTIEHPSVTSTLPLPDTTRADVRLTTSVRNHDDAPVSGTLRGRFGEVAFDVPVTVPARGVQTVTLDPASVPGLRLANPRLWWPNGYGEPSLYDVELRFETSAAVSDAKAFSVGRAAVHAHPRGRHPQDVDQRPPLHPTRWQLGIPRVDAPVSRPRVRRGRPLPQGSELQHDPQLGGADGRRRVLRGLRQARHRRVAGLLAGQPVGRPRSPGGSRVHGQRDRPGEPRAHASIGRPLLRPQRGLPAKAARRCDSRAAGGAAPRRALHLQFGR